MRDVTPLFASFREAARHLWNTTFFYRSEFVPEIDWDRRDAYGRVLIELFAAVVLAPLGDTKEKLPGLWERAADPLARFIVRPNHDDTPILINRATPKTEYWDDPVKRIDRDDAQMQFVGLFDWNELALRDLEFVEARIAAFPKHRELTGRYALLRFRNAQFLFDDA